MSSERKFRVIVVRNDGTHAVISHGNDRELAEKILELVKSSGHYQQAFIEPDDD